MIILGIETSCDETAAAVVTSDRQIKSNVVRSQLKDHQPYGGVVPEIGARAHMDILDVLIKQAIQEAGVSIEQLDGVAVTGGPGLIGGVIVGVMMAKSIAAVHNLPFLAVNHLVGHALTVRLTDNIPFPYFLLLVSGGHCQTLMARGVDDFELLGTSMDDAVGEAFDKTARLLGLPYPGGPEIEKQAIGGDSTRFDFPRPLMKGNKDKYNFSFSGLKTAVRQKVNSLGELSTQDVSDICASFQAAVGDVLVNRCQNALLNCMNRSVTIQHLVVAGGVAANQYLLKRLRGIADTNGISLVAPPVNLCTDNAAMIAWAGLERLQLGLTDTFDFKPRPRWPLNKDK